MPSGNKHHAASLKDEDLINIFKLKDLKYTHVEIGCIMRIPRSTISGIISGNRRKYDKIKLNLKGL